MKKIEAIIPPFKLAEVKEELLKIDVQDFTVIEMKNFSPDARHLELYRGAEVIVDFRFAIKIEAICTAGSAEAVRDAVARAASRGRNRDGILIVSNIEQAFDF